MSDLFRRAVRGNMVAAMSSLALLLACGNPAHAITFEYDYFGGIVGTLNTEFSLGGQW